MVKLPQITCIYKITSPSGKVYIGQTINVRRRFLDYCSKGAHKQPVLARSIKKYGWNLHAFEIIHELPKDVSQETLNQYECLYMEIYRHCGVKLLNAKEGGSNGRNSDESIKKANDKWKEWYKRNPIDGKKWISKSVAVRKGVLLSKEHRAKLSTSQKGKVFSDDHKKNLSLATKGKKKEYSEEFKETKRRHILNYAGKNKIEISQYTISGEFIRDWDSGTSAAKQLGVSRKGIERCLKKQRGGKTFGGFTWRYK